MMSVGEYSVIVCVCNVSFCLVGGGLRRGVRRSVYLELSLVLFLLCAQYLLCVLLFPLFDKAGNGFFVPLSVVYMG